MCVRINVVLANGQRKVGWGLRGEEEGLGKGNIKPMFTHQPLSKCVCKRDGDRQLTEECG